MCFDRKQPQFLVIAGAVSLLGLGMLVYSQTLAFAWDEGFHLLAAQLILAGKRPYLDFFFPQTPLYAAWNAAWMRIFGENWRVAHALSAILTAGAVLLAADFVFVRFEQPAWRLTGGLAVTLLAGLNTAVFGYGTIGQPYGLCLFLVVAAFRLSILAADRRQWLWPASAGFCAGVAAASSLLTAPVGPLLLGWTLCRTRAGARWSRFGAFTAGAVVPFLPLLWLFAEAPRQVFFNVVEYHLLYRQVDWPGATGWDLEVLTSWMRSLPAVLLALFAALGLLFLAVKSGWDGRRRSEFYLCGWLAAAQGAWLLCAHPTFSQYFLLLVPFLAILASVGLCAAGSRISPRVRPLGALLVVTPLLCFGLAKSLWEDRDAFRWEDFEQTARKADQVTPPAGLMLADEQIYFLMRRIPPSGMENSDTHKLRLPASLAASLHVIPQPELDRQVAAGRFDTVATCEDDDTTHDWGLPGPYTGQAEVGSCSVFWKKVSPARSASEIHAIHGQEFLHVRMLALLQFAHRAKIDDTALEQKHNAVGDPPHQVKVVSNHQRGQPELLLQPQHQVRQVVRHDGIHHRRRLVVEDAFGLGG